jgi:hypothetical protein
MQVDDNLWDAGLHFFQTERVQSTRQTLLFIIVQEVL